MARLKLLAFLFLAATLSACSCGNPNSNPPLTDGGTDAGIVTDGGVTDGGVTDGGITDGGVTDGGVTDGGTTDGGVTDGGVAWDGCSLYTATEDTDGDGLPDWLEDRNCNGVVDTGETSRLSIDSDCDGLVDGPSNAAKGWKGEDLNGNGKVDPGETDPTNPDTDGDGLLDGVEEGVATDPDSACGSAGDGGYPGDQCPNTTTSPTNPDTDGDGISDGTEDSNHDGCTETGAGETDPNAPDTLPDGGVSVVQEACSTDNLRPVVFPSSNGGKLKLGLPASFTEVKPISVSGNERGLMGYDATDHVAFIAFSDSGGHGTTALDDETFFEGELGSSPVTSQKFTTWDGFPARQAFYSQSGSGNVIAQANSMAQTLLGTAGVLTGTDSVSGPFELEAEYVHRSDTETAVVIALAPSSLYPSSEPTYFSVGDTAGGSGLAEFTDQTSTRCEKFTTAPAKVDFLFVVDDSGSMASYQSALASAGSAMAAKLNNAYLDWRIGMVETDYHISGQNNSGVFRGFTSDINQFEAWLLQNSNCSSGMCSLPTDGGSPVASCGTWGGSNGGCWVNENGSGNEGSLGAARKALDDLDSAGKLRAGAEVVVVLLGDADDQTKDYTDTSACGQAPNSSCTVENVQDFINYFTGQNDPGDTAKNQFNQSVQVNGIVCPDNSYCGEYQGGSGTNGDARRNVAVINATGGIRGDITSTSGITNAIDQIVDNAINAAGHVLAEPPIGASIKVVLQDVKNESVCPKANPSDHYYDLPRSRQNGFDFDGLTQKLSFFGACVPAVPNVTPAAVSYRSWVKSDVCPADCGGACGTGEMCNPTTCSCEACPADFCNSCGAGHVCDANACTCEVCSPPAGGCSAGTLWDQNSCSCQTCSPPALPDGGTGCPSGEQWDQNTCSCPVCSPPALPDGGTGCPPGQGWDQPSCSCIVIG